jgi:hypothetical protein
MIYDNFWRRASITEDGTKMISVVFAKDDKVVHTVDFPAEIAGGFAIWLYSAVQELEGTDTTDLPPFDGDEAYRIIG